jgi:hypothetical protein
MTSVVSTQAPALIFGHVQKFQFLQHVKICSDVFAKH